MLATSLPPITDEWPAIYPQEFIKFSLVWYSTYFIITSALGIYYRVFSAGGFVCNNSLIIIYNSAIPIILFLVFEMSFY